MPIYEYRCAACGHQQEFLQKVSDPPPTACSVCGKSALSKMLTAAGFQLKGSGWYATDFKSKAPAAAGANAEAKPAGEAQPAGEAKAAGDPKPEGAGKDAAPACGAGGCPACS